MTIDILLVLVGLALVVFGADWLVDGASAVARKAGISEFVIGLTIVGFGTSCPELVVSLTGAIQGNADISIGNVVGSNIFNTLLILGLTAALIPVAVSKENTKRDIPITLLVTLFFIGVALTNGGISRIEGIVFLLIFAAYLYYCFKFDSGNNSGEEEHKAMNAWVAVLLIAAGLAGLIFGGQLFVNHATSIAHAIGVSDKVIALTLLAGGTSLPELATSIVAATKHKAQLALGNILGSNVFNILLILGCSSIITPLSTASMTAFDYGALALSAAMLLLWSFVGGKNKIDRWEGIVMLLTYAAYMVVLFLN
jgi:cation:H+ antiporter